MPPAAGVMPQGGDRIQVKSTIPMPQKQPQVPMMNAAATEAFAKDALIAWFRGEFAAANAIIDALCGHLAQVEGGGGAGETTKKVYESVFAAIHRRRFNWIPILQMQKFYSIADVTVELEKVSSEKRRIPENVAAEADEVEEEVINDKEDASQKNLEDFVQSVENEDFASEITDSGSQEAHPISEPINICSNHEDCEARRAQFKMTKGFAAKEPVKGHIVNVVRGLKLYEDVFNDIELSKLNDFVNEFRVAGQNGELSGETFILYNQQKKGNKRELLQLGVPIFGQIKEDANKFQKGCIEPIPVLLQDVIDHLIQWRLIPQNRKPNSCIINFFDEGEYSQPFLKPPHLEQPLSTLLLSESTMAFGHTLVADAEGNYRGPLMLSLKQGSLLVMRGNSSDTARHVMCSSQNKRASITFFRVRDEIEITPSETTTAIPLPSKAMTLWQPGVVPTPCTVPNKCMTPMTMIPKWGLVRTPMVMLSPVRPIALAPRRIERGGTGVFLPWGGGGSRKHTRHLPPRAQRRRLLSLPGARRQDMASESGTNSP